MNWKWNTNHPNMFEPQKNKKTYWQNLTAPLTPEEKILRYWCCLIFSFVIVWVLIYKFKTDVVYELQFQLTFISKKYYWLTSKDMCLWLLLFFNSQIFWLLSHLFNIHSKTRITSLLSISLHVTDTWLP